MVSVLDSNESLSVFRSYCAAGDTNAPAFVEVGGEKVAVVALVLMPQSGWRDLSQRLGWEPAFLGCLDGIVEDWLDGTDRRELLALARNTRAPSALQSAHRELLALWLNEKRMERLELLTETLGHNRHFAHCYALSHAWRELVAALDHTNAMPAVEPSKPPASPDLAVAMLLDHLGEKDAAALPVLQDGEILTEDLGGDANTQQVGDAVARLLGE